MPAFGHKTGIETDANRKEVLPKSAVFLFDATKGNFLLG